MKWTSALALSFTATCPYVCHAAVYLTTEQTKSLMFPQQMLQHQTIQLTNEQLRTLQNISGIHSALKLDQIFKTPHHDWLVIDQVIGKHEMITYAVALNANGTIKQVEILEYNESYGAQVNNKPWKKQFEGKTPQSALTLNQDIQNISGATLSSKHVTDGVRRIAHLYDLVLKHHD